MQGFVAIRNAEFALYTIIMRNLSYFAVFLSCFIFVDIKTFRATLIISCSISLMHMLLFVKYT